MSSAAESAIIDENDMNEQEVSPSEEDEVDAMSPTNKMKYATLDIYRPPGVRSGAGASSNTKSKLNANAKEFVTGTQTRKSDGDKESHADEGTLSPYAEPFKPYPLSTSKSSIEISLDNRPNHKKALSNETGKDAFNLLRAKSSHSIPWAKLRNAAMVSKTIAQNADDCLKTKKTSPREMRVLKSASGNLQRARSPSANDILKLVELDALPAKSFTEYDLFPVKLHKLIQVAVESTDRMEDKGKIALGRKVVELAVEDANLASVAAKLSVIIIDKDDTEAYYDSLLNTCQMLYQTKTGHSLSQPKQLAAFLAFLKELYAELKRSKVQIRRSETYESILALMATCCVDILEDSGAYSVHEIESLFVTLKKVGPDLENVAPQMFKRVFDTLREVLEAGLMGPEVRPEIRKVFLQLLELRAFEWQLPLAALHFYYPKVLA